MNIMYLNFIHIISEFLISENKPWCTKPCTYIPICSSIPNCERYSICNFEDSYFIHWKNTIFNTCAFATIISPVDTGMIDT